MAFLLLRDTVERLDLDIFERYRYHLAHREMTVGSYSVCKLHVIL